MLRYTRFGSDQQTLLTILNSIVMPTISYPSIIYNSASYSHLKSLDPTVKAGVKGSLGAFEKALLHLS